jgi:AraC family cel operon transcriptional repressor
MHYHDFYEIFFITEGALIHCIENEKRETLQKGDLCFVVPYQSHSFQKDCSGVCRLSNLAIQQEYFETFLSSHSLCVDNLKRSLPIEEEERFFILAQDTFSLCVGKIDEKIAQIKKESILFECISLLFSPLSQFDPQTPSWLYNACKTVEQASIETISSEMLVALCHRSQSHVIRMMKKYFGTTPTAFCNDLRIQAARELLLSSSSKIYDIYQQTGFTNLAYFNKLFKKKYGLTPREMRRAYSLNTLNPMEHQA